MGANRHRGDARVHRGAARHQGGPNAMNAMRTIRKLKMWKCIQAAMKATAAAAIIAATLTHPATPPWCADIKVFSSPAQHSVLRDLAPEFERTTGHSLVVH